MISVCFVFSAHVGDEFDVHVQITTDESIRLSIELPVIIPRPLAFKLRFTDTQGPSPPIDRISADSFINMQDIEFEVSRLRVPFPQFKLQVALVVRNNIGPFIPSNLETASEYGKS